MFDTEKCVGFKEVDRPNVRGSDGFRLPFLSQPFYPSIAARRQHTRTCLAKQSKTGGPSARSLRSSRAVKSLRIVGRKLLHVGSEESQADRTRCGPAPAASDDKHQVSPWSSCCEHLDCYDDELCFQSLCQPPTTTHSKELYKTNDGSCSENNGNVDCEHLQRDDDDELCGDRCYQSGSDYRPCTTCEELLTHSCELEKTNDDYCENDDDNIHSEQLNCHEDELRGDRSYQTICEECLTCEHTEEPEKSNTCSDGSDYHNDALCGNRSSQAICEPCLTCAQLVEQDNKLHKINECFENDGASHLEHVNFYDDEMCRDRRYESVCRPCVECEQLTAYSNELEKTNECFDIEPEILHNYEGLYRNARVDKNRMLKLLRRFDTIRQRAGAAREACLLRLEMRQKRRLHLVDLTDPECPQQDVTEEVLGRDRPMLENHGSAAEAATWRKLHGRRTIDVKLRDVIDACGPATSDNFVTTWPPVLDVETKLKEPSDAAIGRLMSQFEHIRLDSVTARLENQKHFGNKRKQRKYKIQIS